MDSKNKAGQLSGCSTPDAEKVWQAVLGELQLQMTQATFDTWLRGSRVISCVDRTYTVYVRHAYAVDWLQNRLFPLIVRTLQRRAGPNVDIVFTARLPERDEHLVLVPEIPPEDPPPVRKPRPTRVNQRSSASLAQRYTFENFVVGPSNRLVHAASLAVAENPAHAYNPLFIYGGAGLGKTHLLHALGHVTRRRGLSVLYVSAESFTNDLIVSIRSGKTRKFRAKYRNNDVLLVDDVQFIAGKEATQEEFFHTFNTLHGAGKQIVISCDRPPKALLALEDRLCSRFGWGLIADVQPPDYEIRVAILQAKAEATSAEVPDDVISYIARKILSNIRELEGALTRVVAHANLMDVPLNVETARMVLESILTHTAEVTPERILATVAGHYNLTEDQLTGRSRARLVSVPRQLCMYMLREETKASFPQIGKFLGGRDHTTILHGCGKISNLIEADGQLRRDWLAIKGVLSGGAAAL